MSIQQTTIKASTLLTVLCLSSALAITSCGKKNATETTQTTTKTETTAAPTTGAATAPAATTPAPAAGAGGALSAAEKTQLTPVKTALVMANSAIKSGDIAKAKTQFAKFSSVWPTVEPLVKAKAGANYAAISSGIEMVKTAMGSATPDKAKAAEGLTSTIKAMNAVIDKK
jgi:iron uptake system EfeUOB component EfeO/EfeM